MLNGATQLQIIDIRLCKDDWTRLITHLVIFGGALMSDFLLNDKDAWYSWRIYAVEIVLVF